MKDTGRIHIYYGDGKGKTSAAVGVAVRAAGAGLQVLFFQFLKGNDASERNVLEQVDGITVLYGQDMDKKVRNLNSDERVQLRKYDNKALDEIVKFCTHFDVLILDEVLTALELKLISEEKLVSFLKHKPRGLEIVLTGERVTEKVIEQGDYITRMRKVRHPADQGKLPRKGIEY